MTLRVHVQYPDNALVHRQEFLRSYIATGKIKVQDAFTHQSPAKILGQLNQTFTARVYLRVTG